jgi:hypothetical protein
MIFMGDVRFWEKNVAAGFSLRNITLSLPYLEAQPKGCGYILIVFLRGLVIGNL